MPKSEMGLSIKDCRPSEDINSENLQCTITNKKKDQNRKRQVVENVNDGSNSAGKMLKYNPSELMNKLEKFSEVWNDCPVVHNPKQNTDHWFRGSPHKQTFNQVTVTGDGYKGNGYTNHFQKRNVNEKGNFQIVKEEVQNSSNKKSVDPPNCCVEESVKSSDKKKYDLEKKTAKESKIESPVVDSSNSSDKYDSRQADVKRRKAVQEQRQIHIDQKNIIKKALSSMDGQQSGNKKIIFGDTEDFEEDCAKNSGFESDKSRPKLFDDDDSESETDLKFNHQFEGKKGQKLLELQSKYASDSRFTLDTRFYESGSEDSERELLENECKGHVDEKKKQLAILESIIKQPIKPLSEVRKISKKYRDNDTLLLRFDPSREDHTKYIVKPQEKQKNEERTEKKKNKKTLKLEAESTFNNIPVPENKTQVSTEKFFSVKEDLKEVLKNENKTEFSLLKLFGSKEKESSPRPEQSQSKTKLKHGTKNPFKYDSSDSEPEEEKQIVEDKEIDDRQRLVKTVPVSWKTSFFFTENDPRLQEALEFLKVPEEAEDQKEYAEKRKILKDFIRNKYKNNTRKKSHFKKKLGGFKKKVFQKKKRKQS